MIGPSLTEEERLHKIALERLVIDLGLLDRVDIRHAVPRHTVPGLYAEVDALVNDMREGATDKVVYEAAATCMPVLASNPAFDTLLPPELRFASGDVDALALAIVGLLSADRDAVGRSLREIVAPRALGRDVGRPGRRTARGDGPGSSTSRRSRGSPARRTTCSCCCPRSASAASTSSS